VKARNIIMIALVAALFVVATALLVHGISSHQEPGLLRVQVDPNTGHYFYAETPEEVEAFEEFAGYGTGTVSVAFTVDEDDETMAWRVVPSVMGRINHRLGYEVLVRDDPFDQCSESSQICVRLNVAASVGTPMTDANGDAQHFNTEDSGLHCDARTWNTGTGEATSIALRHEILHCLGLAHDHYEQSIMCGSRPYNGREDCTLRGHYEGFSPTISDHDRRVLRELYLEE
jgi:hypothetical protein